MAKHHSLNILLALLICYLFPIILFSIYSMSLIPLNDSWKLFVYGLVGGILAALTLYILINRSLLPQQEESLSEGQSEVKEKTVQTSPASSEWADQALSLKESISHLEEKCVALEQRCDELKAELIEKNEALEQEKKEQEICREHLVIAKQEFFTYQQACEEQLKSKELFVQECQHSFREQRLQIDKLQQHIAFLENKERDLHYEIKTLLQLTSFDKPAESVVNNPIPQPIAKPHSTVQEEEDETPLFEMPGNNLFSRTPEDAKHQLKRFIDTATKMTGAHYFGSSSGRLPMDNYVLDLRRLFDGLSDENHYIVIVYSQKENKILFSNQLIKNVLGWSSDKFVQHFSEIMQESHEEWRKALGQLTINPEVQLTFSAKARSGKMIPLQCYLGAIYTGLFKHHAIGVMYPKT